MTLARRHGTWIAPLGHRLQDHALVEELAAVEQTPIVIDPTDYGETLIAALRERGVSVSEGDLDQGLGRFLSALGAITETGQPAPRIALPPMLIRAELRATALTYCDACASPPPPNVFDDPSLRRREPPQRDDFDLLL